MKKNYLFLIIFIITLLPNVVFANFNLSGVDVAQFQGYDRFYGCSGNSCISLGLNTNRDYCLDWSNNTCKNQLTYYQKSMSASLARGYDKFVYQVEVPETFIEGHYYKFFAVIQIANSSTSVGETSGLTGKYNTTYNWGDSQPNLIAKSAYFDYAGVADPQLPSVFSLPTVLSGYFKAQSSGNYFGFEFDPDLKVSIGTYYFNFLGFQFIDLGPQVSESEIRDGTYDIVHNLQELWTLEEEQLHALNELNGNYLNQISYSPPTRLLTTSSIHGYDFYVPEKFSFYNSNGNTFSPITTAEQHDNDTTYTYFYANTNGVYNDSNGLYLVAETNYIVPKGYQVFLSFLVCSTGNTNFISKSDRVYTGMNSPSQFFTTAGGEKLYTEGYNFDGKVQEFDDVPINTYAMTFNKCYVVSSSFTTQTNASTYALHIGTNSNVSLGNFISIFGFDISMLGENGEYQRGIDVDSDYVIYDENLKQFLLRGRDSDGPNNPFYDFITSIQDFGSTTLSDVITAPIDFIQSFDDVCQPVVLSVFNTDITLPCGSTIFWNKPGVSTFYTIWDLLFGGFSIYFLMTKFVKLLRSWTDPYSDKLEVFDL